MNPQPVASTRGLAVTLTVLVPLLIAMSIIARALEPATMTAEAGEVYVEQMGLGAVVVVLSLATIVVGLIWCYRVAANARAVGDPSRPSPGWALGAWFIPVAHVVLPFLPLLAAWKKSRAGSTALFGAWWLFFAAHLLLAYTLGIWGAVMGFQAGLGAGGEAVVVDLPAAYLTTAWVNEGIYAVAGVFFLGVVWRFHSAQQQMAAWVARQTPPTAAPAFR